MTRILWALVAFVAALVVAGSALATPPTPQKQPVAVGTGGAAATVDPLATEAAIDVLRRGGNAVDAAVAAAAVLGVTEPYSCGLGGGGFMVVYRASDGKVTTLDGRETAPAAFTPTTFLENGSPISFSEAVTSGLGVGVPGTPALWEAALEQFGTMRLPQVLTPAIAVARRGFEVDATFRDQTLSNLARFRDFTTTRELFLTETGDAPAVGSILRNPELAKTYQTLMAHGMDAFYTGPLAQAIVDTVRRPPLVAGATRNVRPGLMTTADLAGYELVERAPTRVGYRGLDVYGMGPPSSGGSTVGEALNILEGFDLAAMSRGDAFHYMIEASKLSYADRGAFLGDSDFVDVPLAGLLSDAYAATRRALIGPTPLPVQPPGDPWPFDSVSVLVLAAAAEGPETTHLTVSDRWGNVVSYTFTIESTGGSGIAVPEAGFLLNNELTDFNFVPNTANSPAGGKRPRSSMAPTIVLDDGRPMLALGSPGGATIITTVLQLLVDTIDFGATLPQAIAAPRVSQRNTTATQVETSFVGTAEHAALAARGHTFTTTAEIGAATGIELLAGDVARASAEPVRRGAGHAAVVRPSG